jgi:hypothetical protein
VLAELVVIGFSGRYLSPLGVANWRMAFAGSRMWRKRASADPVKNP